MLPVYRTGERNEKRMPVPEDTGIHRADRKGEDAGSAVLCDVLVELRLHSLQALLRRLVGAVGVALGECSQIGYYSLPAKAG